MKLSMMVTYVLIFTSFVFAQQQDSKTAKSGTSVSWDKTGGKKVAKVSLISRKSPKKKKTNSVNAVAYDFIDRAVDSIQAELKKFSLFLGKVSPPPAFTGKVKKKEQKYFSPQLEDMSSLLSEDNKLVKLKKLKEEAIVSFEKNIFQKKQSIQLFENEILALEASIKSFQDERNSLLKTPFDFNKEELVVPPPLNAATNQVNPLPQKNVPKKKKEKVPSLQSRQKLLESRIFSLEKKIVQSEKKLEYQKKDLKYQKRNLEKSHQNHAQSLIRIDEKILARERYLRDFYRKKSHPKKLKAKEVDASGFSSIDEILPKDAKTPYKASIMMISLDGPFVPSLSGYIASEVSRRKYRFRSGQDLYFIRCIECEKVNLEFRKDGKVNTFSKEVKSEDYREQARELGLDFYGFITFTRYKGKLVLEFTLREVITGDIIFATDYSKLVVAAGKSSFWWTVSGDMNIGNAISRRIPVTLGTELGYRIPRLGGFGVGITSGVGFITDVNATVSKSGEELPPAADPSKKPGGVSSYTFNYLGIIPTVMLDFMDMFRARDREFSLLFTVGGGPKFLVESEVQKKFGFVAIGFEFGFRFCIGQYLFLKLGGHINLAKNPATGDFEVGPPLDGGEGFLGFGINIF